MSAIGDYVHLTYAGYQDPASAQQRPEAFPRDYTNLEIREDAAIDVFQKQRNRMQELVAARGNRATAKKIQDKIRTFQGAMGDNTAAQKKFYNQFIKALEQRLNVVFDELLQASPTTDSAVNTAEVVSIKKALRNIRDATRRKTKSGSAAGVSFKSTLVPLQSALEKLGASIQNGTINTDSVDEVQDLWTKLQSEVLSYKNEINRISQAAGHPDIFLVTNNTAKSNKANGEMVISITGGKDVSLNLVAFAQLVAEVIDALSPNLKKAKGDAAELVVAAASAVSAGKAISTVDEAMKAAAEYHKGNQSGRIAYVPGETSEDVMRELSNSHWKLDERSGVIVANLATQNKEDVTFYVDEQPFAVSVKNYNYYMAKFRGFGGVSGSPFLFLAQELATQNENDMFINHWINSTIYHASAAGETDNAVQGSPVAIKEAHAVMRYSLVILGALGGVRKVSDGTLGNTSMVDYLVWNDSTGTTGDGMHVFAFSTVLNNIYDRIVESPKKWVGGYDDKFNIDAWSAGKMLSEVQASGSYKTPMQIKRRISKILAYMHAAKITTHFFLDDQTFTELAIKNI